MDTLTTTTATAGAMPDSPEWIIGKAIEAFSSKDWAMIAALVLMAVVLISRRLAAVQAIPAKAIPWVTQLGALLGAVAIGLYSRQSWETILTTAVTVGLMATGLWESIGKLFRDMFRKMFGGATDDMPPPSGGAQ